MSSYSKNEIVGHWRKIPDKEIKIGKSHRDYLIGMALELIKLFGVIYRNNSEATA